MQESMMPATMNTSMSLDKVASAARSSRSTILLKAASGPGRATLPMKRSQTTGRNSI